MPAGHRPEVTSGPQWKLTLCRQAAARTRSATTEDRAAEVAGGMVAVEAEDVFIAFSAKARRRLRTDRRARQAHPLITIRNCDALAAELGEACALAASPTNLNFLPLRPRPTIQPLSWHLLVPPPRQHVVALPAVSTPLRFSQGLRHSDRQPLSKRLLGPAWCRDPRTLPCPHPRPLSCPPLRSPQLPSLGSQLIHLRSCPRGRGPLIDSCSMSSSCDQHHNKALVVKPTDIPAEGTLPDGGLELDKLGECAQLPGIVSRDRTSRM